MAGKKIERINEQFMTVRSKEVLKSIFLQTSSIKRPGKSVPCGITTIEKARHIKKATNAMMDIHRISFI